jgi:hypothetical protein
MIYDVRKSEWEIAMSWREQVAFDEMMLMSALY